LRRRDAVAAEAAMRAHVAAVRHTLECSADVHPY